MVAPLAFEVPIIDISGYLAGDVQARPSIVKKVQRACEDYGFLQIVGHSVPADLQSRYLASLAAFFALPAEEKDKVDLRHSKCHRGYERIGAQKLDQLDVNATADQKESFYVGRDRPLGGYLQGPNQWPDNPPRFKEVYTEYMEAMRGLSNRVFRLVALSLELEETYFDDIVADPDGIGLCRAHHYPPTAPDPAGCTRGVGAHTDFGALTLLLQDGVGGLEVLHKPTETWHAVVPVPGAYVVNIGDLMERWTNTRYRSTMHRVISPLNDGDRYSSAFFNDGPLDRVIECLPTCLKPGEEPLYGPIKVVDHLKERYRQSYA